MMIRVMVEWWMPIMGDVKEGCRKVEMEKGGS